MIASLLVPRRRLVGLATALALVLGAPAAHAASTLWYNGDLDGRDALLNQTGVPGSGPDGYVYDNFIVPNSTTFNITGVFSNDVFNSATRSPRTAYWEIRSGVSAGNGGTLIASGDAADTLTATGRTFNIGGINRAEWTNLVSGLNVTLGAGTYWLTVAPDIDGQFSYNSTTSGANAIGQPPGNDGNSFYTSAFFGQNFTPTSDPSLEDMGTWDYSMGVIGTSQTSVIPEPASITMALAGGLTLAGCVFRRRKSGAGATAI